MVPGAQSISKWGYDRWKTNVLSRRRNIDSDGTETTFSGSALYLREAETLNVRLPTLDGQNDWHYQSAGADRS